MPGRFPGADDTSDLFALIQINFGPGVNDHYNHCADHSHRSPARLMRIWIVTSHSERIVENERGSLKTEAVCPQICPVLVRVPSPTQRLRLCE